MNAKISQLFGTFKKDGSKLTRADLPGYLQIGKRRNPTPKKPLHFIVYKAEAGEQYISSMYPLSDALSAFRIEYGGTLARVEYETPDTVIISSWA
jgi:hypothetical protein